jgi:hypothetical protein
MVEDKPEEEKCPECGGEPLTGGWVALAHQIEGDEDVNLCSLGCLVGYLKEHAE